MLVMLRFCRIPLEQDEGEGEAKVPCAVDLSRLEQVLEKAPPGLQMAEAAKARKTATRSGDACC